MADVVTRLVVESKEYDSKIARATQGLTQFEKKCRDAGGTLEFVEKEDLEFVKALGKMETVSTSATGKLSEMKKAFTELSVQYKNLSDAEKQSPYGQALAGSLEQLKGRIGELGGQLSEAGKEMQTSSGFADKLADGLGQLGPVGQMAGKLIKGAFGPVGIAIAAVVGFIQQLVEAFKRNENAMASAERAAAPFKAIWQQIQRIFDKLVPLIADGIEKISEGIQSMFGKLTEWTGKLANTKIGKKLGLEAVYLQLKRVSEVQDELTGSNKRIADSENELNRLRRSATVNNARNEKEIAKLREQATEKDKYNAAERVQMLEKAAQLEEQIMQRNLDIKRKELEVIKLKNSLITSGTEDLQAQADAEAAVLQEETNFYNKQRALRRQIQSARDEDAKTGGIVTSETSTTSDDPYMSAFEKMQQSIRIKLADQNFKVDETSLTNLMTVAIQNGIEGMDGAFEGLQYQLAEGLNIPDEAWEDLAAQINEQLANLGIDPIVIDVKTGGVKTLNKEVEKTTDHVAGAASAFQALGNAMEQIDDPGAKVAGMIAEAIGSVAAGYGAATAQAATLGPWAWIAFAATGLATMISMIAGIKSATAGSYASGGIIPGNSFSGDNLTANVNSGELILNRAQQGAIASQLETSNPLANLQLSTEISGTNLRIVLNNDNRSRGGSRGFYSSIK